MDMDWALLMYLLSHIRQALPYAAALAAFNAMFNFGAQPQRFVRQNAVRYVDLIFLSWLFDSLYHHYLNCPPALHYMIMK